MSLKVPKANNIELFKEGYKVRDYAECRDSCSHARSTSKDSTMPFCAISRQ